MANWLVAEGAAVERGTYYQASGFMDFIKRLASSVEELAYLRCDFDVETPTVKSNKNNERGNRKMNKLLSEEWVQAIDGLR